MYHLANGHNLPGSFGDLKGLQPGESLEGSIRMRPPEILLIIRRTSGMKKQTMPNRLSGKRVFITGAAQRIGQAIAGAYAAEDTRLFLVDRDETLLEQTAAALASKAHLYLALRRPDITDASAIEAAGVQGERADRRHQCPRQQCRRQHFCRASADDRRRVAALLRHQPQGRLALLPFGSAAHDFGRAAG